MKKVCSLLAGALLAFTLNAQVDTAAYEKIDFALDLVGKHYVDSFESEKIVEDAIKGMLKNLDPHSKYIPKKNVKKMNESLVGNFEGVGIQFNIFRDTVLVVNVIDGGPCKAAGIMAGDKIIKVDQALVAGINIKNGDVIKRLKGKKGTEVTMTIKRFGEEGLVDYKIKRGKVPIKSVVSYYMVDDEIGYVKLQKFSGKSMSEFSKAVKELKSKGMRKMIFDLQGNSGGYLKTSILLSDEFLMAEKLIVYTEGERSKKEVSNSTGRGAFEQGSLVVLVDEGSASASEIVSGAIQDWDRGLIIGRKTFGKGLVQKQYRFPDGSMVRLTTARYYTPSGRCIQKPYKTEKKSKYKEFNKKLTNGEIAYLDSIKQLDTTNYTTFNNREVFAGGGIMPDIYVMKDKSMDSDYYTALTKKGVFDTYIFTWLESNRFILNENYGSFNQFNLNFTVDKDMMDGFVVFAEKNGVEKDKKGLNTSYIRIQTYLKALIARTVWENKDFYEVFNNLNPVYRKAVEVLEEDGLAEYGIVTR